MRRDVRVNTTLCPDRWKELVYTSRSVRVISDSTDQSDQAPDRDTPPSVHALGHKGQVIQSSTLSVLPARTVTMPFLASASCTCIRGSVLSCSASGYKTTLAML